MADVAALRALGKLGELLRCPICGDLLDAPVLFPECSHTFCSKCIRLALSYKPQCPACRGNRETTRVVAVHVLDEVMGVLRGLPDGETLLESLAKRAKLKEREDNNNNNNDNNNDDDDDDDDDGVNGGRNELLSQSQQSQRSECPFCGLMVRDMGRHESECLNKGEQERANFVEAHNKDASLVRQPLPKLVYNLKSTKDLQRVCSDMGISASGNRALLEWRHMQYITMYNANLDHAQPKPVASIKEELKSIEKATHPPGSEKLFAAKRSRSAEKQPEWKKLVEMARPKKIEKKAEAKEEKQVEEVIEQDDVAVLKNDVDEFDDLVVELEEDDEDDDENHDGLRDEPALLKTPTTPALGDAAVSEWQVVFSEVANKPFYYNTRTQIGTFVRPSTIKY